MTSLSQASTVQYMFRIFLQTDKENNEKKLNDGTTDI